jgi:hypothetical protein
LPATRQWEASGRFLSSSLAHAVDRPFELPHSG